MKHLKASPWPDVSISRSISLYKSAWTLRPGSDKCINLWRDASAPSGACHDVCHRQMCEVSHWKQSSLISSSHRHWQEGSTLTENWHVTNRRYVRRSEAWQWFWMNLYMHICFFVVFMNHFGKHYLIGFRLRLEVDSCSTCYHRECHSIGFNWESGVSGRLPFRLLRDALGRDKLYFTRWEWECSGN